jgi:hypothetical protein
LSLVPKPTDSNSAAIELGGTVRKSKDIDICRIMFGIAGEQTVQVRRLTFIAHPPIIFLDARRHRISE